jgi:hypothetical protein
MMTGSGGVRAGKWSDRLPGAKYWHAEFEALEAEMAGGSAILASDEDFRSRRHMADFANHFRTFREAFSPGFRPISGPRLRRSAA